MSFCDVKDQLKWKGSQKIIYLVWIEDLFSIFLYQDLVALLKIIKK